jgi:hypothetical protein
MSNANGTPRLIAWSGKLALLCLVLVPLAVLSVRVGLDFRIGLGIFALSCLAALAVVLVMTITWLLPPYKEHRNTSLKNALTALPPALLLLAVMGSTGDYPAIHDITTDTDDPPIFDAAPSVRAEGTNPLTIKPESIALQLEFYPDVGSIETTLSEEKAFSRASEVAALLEWQIYNSDPRIGLIEASYTWNHWKGKMPVIYNRER